MGLVEVITKLKDVSLKLRDKNISDREVIIYNQELHQLIDKLEIPELINIEELTGANNEYIS
tara:strand:- start:94 stop:279 length:186 start_codon:yes stop_codon:yes gene_type:complete